VLIGSVAVNVDVAVLSRHSHVIIIVMDSHDLVLVCWMCVDTNDVTRLIGK
jgi:hypothetical protein